MAPLQVQPEIPAVFPVVAAAVSVLAVLIGQQVELVVREVVLWLIAVVKVEALVAVPEQRQVHFEVAVTVIERESIVFVAVWAVPHKVEVASVLVVV